jgi:hypothetical protein
MKREQLIELRRLGFSIDFIMKATGIKAAKINNMFYRGCTKFSEDEVDVSDRFYADAVTFMSEWDLNYFVVTYLLHNKPREFKTKAMGGFEARQNFKEWADGLDSPVKVVRVEKLEL